MQRNFAHSAKVSHPRDSKAIRQGWRNAVVKQGQPIFGCAQSAEAECRKFYFHRFESAEVHCHPEETVQEWI